MRFRESKFTWKVCKTTKLCNKFFCFFFLIPAVFWSWSSSTTSPALCPECHSHTWTCECQTKIVKASMVVLVSCFFQGDSKIRGAGMKKSFINELINKGKWKCFRQTDFFFFFFTWGFVTEDVGITYFGTIWGNKKNHD